MSIFENTVMIKKRTSAGQLFLQYLLIVLAVICGIGTVLFSPIGLLIPTILLIVGAYFAHGACNVEYEYTYIEGELDIDKIKAKKKRKKVAKIDLDELVFIAPHGSGELNQYANNTDTVKKTAVSGEANARVYDIVYHEGSRMTMVSFEPDQKMLDTLRMRYPRKVIL